MNLLRTMRAAYYAAISFIDYQVGRILDSLESEGELDNTLILYTSDHGELLGDYDCYGKRSFLDAAARIPLLVRYPERFEANAQCDTPTSLVDVLPTSLGAAGLPLQADRSGVESRGSCHWQYTTRCYHRSIGTGGDGTLYAPDKRIQVHLLRR